MIVAQQTDGLGDVDPGVIADAAKTVGSVVGAVKSLFGGGGGPSKAEIALAQARANEAKTQRRFIIGSAVVVSAAALGLVLWKRKR